VSDVRVLGAIGVVELDKPVELQQVQALFVEQGVWVRPFGRLVYLMPPFIISEPDLMLLTQAVVSVVGQIAD
jgi:adenosylmethionine-8-amino-7-oxononanoate aminotransferase